MERAKRLSKWSEATLHTATVTGYNILPGYNYTLYLGIRAKQRILTKIDRADKDTPTNQYTCYILVEARRRTYCQGEGLLQQEECMVKVDMSGKSKICSRLFLGASLYIVSISSPVWLRSYLTKLATTKETRFEAMENKYSRLVQRPGLRKQTKKNTFTFTPLSFTSAHITAWHPGRGRSGSAVFRPQFLGRKVVVKNLLPLKG